VSGCEGLTAGYATNPLGILLEPVAGGHVAREDALVDAALADHVAVGGAKQTRPKPWFFTMEKQSPAVLVAPRQLKHTLCPMQPHVFGGGLRPGWPPQSGARTCRHRPRVPPGPRREPPPTGRAQLRLPVKGWPGRSRVAHGATHGSEVCMCCSRPPP